MAPVAGLLSKLAAHPRVVPRVPVRITIEDAPADIRCGLSSEVTSTRREREPREHLRMSVLFAAST
jgi:multidrug resistance efflux pump